MNLSSSTLEGLKHYTNNYHNYTLKKEVIDKIKTDLSKAKNVTTKFNVKDFLKDSYYYNTGIIDLKTMLIYGSSVVNPMLNIDILILNQLIMYHDNNIYSNTGIDFLTFRALPKIEQNNIINTIRNILINKANDLKQGIENISEDNNNLLGDMDE